MPKLNKTSMLVLAALAGGLAGCSTTADNGNTQNVFNTMLL
ncbi:hypothetical protein JCM19236_1636 [Vibrio sp. JCM 19236]|nr:hypothetical protein JCM19236_1636 [Vibrio sp. JCM 19236]